MTTTPLTAEVELAAATDGVQAAIDAGTALAAPHRLEPGGTYSVVVPLGGRQVTVDRDLDAYRARPRRKAGEVHVTDAEAFAAYWAKHALPESEVYADLVGERLVGVLNAHQAHPVGEDEDLSATADDAGAGWGDHRVTLQLHKTTAWKAWEHLDRQLLSQVDLAEHFEERLVDFRDPTGADMLELAQTFQASRSGAFSSSQRLSSGEVQLDYREEHAASAGKAGRLTVPEAFDLALVPFEGGEPYKVTARFRYRLGGSALRVGYLLTRPEDVLRAAFLDQVAAVADVTAATILRGTPMGPRP